MVTPHGRSIPVTTSSGTSLMLSPHVGVSQLQTGTATYVVVPAGPERDLGGDRCRTARSFTTLGSSTWAAARPSATNKALPAAT